MKCELTVKSCICSELYFARPLEGCVYINNIYFTQLIYKAQALHISSAPVSFKNINLVEYCECEYFKVREIKFVLYIFF